MDSCWDAEFEPHQNTDICQRFPFYCGVLYRHKPWEGPIPHPISRTKYIKHRFLAYFPYFEKKK
jgi:hypothetical protein